MFCNGRSHVLLLMLMCLVLDSLPCSSEPCSVLRFTDGLQCTAQKTQDSFSAQLVSKCDLDGLPDPATTVGVRLLLPVNLAQIAFHQCSGNQCVAFSDIWDSCVGGNGFHPWAMTFMRQKYGRTRYVYVDHEPLGLSWPFCICLVLWFFF